MGFSNQERINMFTKALLSGVIDANASAVWYETFNPYSMVLDGVHILTELASIPAAGNLTTARNNATANPTLIQNKSAAADAVRLTPVAGTNNSTYIAYNTYNTPGSGVLINWLQPQLVQQSSGAPSNGYAVQLYDGDPNAGGTLVSTSEGQSGTGENATVGWIFNYSRGILLLASDFVSSVSNPYIIGFRYIGKTALDAAASGVTVTLVADEAIAVGDAVRLVINGEGGGLTAGRAVKAIATSATAAEVVGIATTVAAAQGNSFEMTQSGSTDVFMDSTPATTTNGASLYLSAATAGRSTLTAPSSSGNVVVQLGKLTGASGSDATPAAVIAIDMIIQIG